jgi:serine/threonine-protein kinase HipA
MKVSESPRKAAIYQQGQVAGHLEESGIDSWIFHYLPGYDGPPVSLTLPVRIEPYLFDGFPAVFEGLLPEGIQLDGLLRRHKIDRNDFFAQLAIVGADVVGSLTVEKHR